MFSFQKSLVLLLSLLLLQSCEWTDISEQEPYISHQVKINQLLIETSKGKILLTGLSKYSIEVLYAKDLENAFPSFAKKEMYNIEASEVFEDENFITFKRGELLAKISKSNLNIRFYLANKFLSEQTSHFTDRKFITEEINDTNLSEKYLLLNGFSFTLTDEEKIMGGGERVLGMDRRGHRMPLYNRAHYGYQTESNQMNFSLPAIMSSKKYAILFDNTASGFLDIGKTESNTLIFEAVGGRQSYIFFAGKTYPEIINNYVDVTGKQPLPPRWMFGNFASRFGYTSQQEVLDTVERYKQEDFPLDAIIIDLYWFGADIKGYMGNLDWDKKTFPKPIEMLSELKDKNIKSILVTEPFILSSSSKWDEAVDKKILAKDEKGEVKRFDFYFGNTGLIDVFDSKAKQWFSNIYTDLSEQGVSGVWGDLGEPEVHPDDSLHYLSDWDMTVRGDEIHNAYGHEWAKMVYQNNLKIKPNERPFMMMRSGFAGSQRYGMIPWTGDVDRSWQGLKPQVELSLQMGLFGLGYTHSDLGGFAGGKTFDKEMYIRWLQYGVFQPVYRPHSQAHIEPEPVFHDKETKDILRNFVKLRYQLLPYNYNLAYQNSTTGMPLMRPVFFEDENQPNLIDIKDSYFWGDAFFVSPITNPNETTHRMRLPEGMWFDFWNETPYVGGKEIDLPVTLETLPVMVRAGSFIPMIDSINNTSEYSSKNLTVHYYADKSVANSEYKLFEDDGENPNSIRDDAFELLIFDAKHSEQKLEMKLSRNGRGYEGMPIERNIKLVIHNWRIKPSEIIINDIGIEKTNFDKSTNKLILNIPWRDKDVSIVISKGE